jgi:hypothetical protein
MQTKYERVQTCELFPTKNKGIKVKRDTVKMLVGRYLSILDILKVMEK